uniref:Plastid-encoded RNA polymerase subunit alpha n=1 Tax=Oedocladium carolinianum TaxID=55992 RepID=A0A8K1JCA1_9CHLO|nr:RNA polymerase alpha subunit [Oedocladium carolinianum]
MFMKKFILKFKKRNFFYIISNAFNYNIFFNIQNRDLPVSLSCRQIVQKNLRDIYGQFYIGPFFLGQGLTIANALRRTLLSELPSLAITSVQMQDVVHQYQTIQGLQESVFDFLLNIKDIVFKSKKVIKVPQIGYLQVQGPFIIRAKDLILPPLIQCVDPEQYIATLSEDGLLNLKFVIRQGKHSLTHVTPGFDPSIPFKEVSDGTKRNITKLNQNKIESDRDSVSLLNLYSKNLIIDASFNPVLKVNYIIELLDFDQISFENDNLKQIQLYRKSFKGNGNIQTSKRINQEAEQNLIKKEIILLEIWTNGSISPIIALKLSIQKLIRVFLKIQKSKILNTRLTDSDILYKDTFEKLDNELNILQFKQCQTLSDFQDSKIRHLSEKVLIEKLKYLINQLD